MARVETPAERILRLAAYLKEVGAAGTTLAALSATLRGYEEDKTGLAGLRKRLRRDLDTLRDSFGILVDVDGDRYTLVPPFFTTDERTALLSAAAVVAVEGVADEAPLGELGASLDDQEARVIVGVHHLVAALRDPIATRTPVQFAYHGRSRTVNPLAVGVWRNRWYLVGDEQESGRRNRYRLDRIDAANVANTPADGSSAVLPCGDPGTFEVPVGFDAEAELRMDPNTWGTDPPVVARVRVDADHLPGFVDEFGATIVEEDATHGVVELEVRHRESFVIRLLGFRGHARLVGPPELVDLVVGWLAPRAEVR